MLCYDYKSMKQIECKDIGLKCDRIIRNQTEDGVVSKVMEHLWEGHAIKPEEMTSEMKAKIKDNIHDDDV